MLKLRPAIDELQPRLGNERSVISEEGFSPLVHDQRLDISILYGRCGDSTQGKSEFSRIPLPGIPARQERAIVDAEQAAAATPATVENDPPARKAQLCTFDAVRPCATSWIWPGRVAKGRLTLLAGEAAAGKSLVLIDLVSRASRGDAFPRSREPGAAPLCADAAPADKAAADKAAADKPTVDKPLGEKADLPKATNVLLLTRDGAEDVVQPRLVAAGADLRRVQTLREFPDADEKGGPATRGFDLEKDLSAVEETLAEQPGIELVVIDDCPLALDSRHRGFNEVSRAILQELEALARRRKVAIVVAVSSEHQAAGHGARRWLDKLLAITQDDFVLALVRDRRRPARRFLLTLRAALGAGEGGATDEGLRWETSGGRIVWSDIAVCAAALGASAGQLDQMDAARWLRQELAFYPRAVVELREAAQEAGFAWHVVCRAKAIAGVDGRREGWGPNGRYFWFLERDGQERAEDEGFWEDLADDTDRSERADWDYQAEPAYREERARLSKLTNPMAAEPDFSAPSDQDQISCEASCGTIDHPGEHLENDDRAAVGALAQPQKGCGNHHGKQKNATEFSKPSRVADRRRQREMMRDER